MSIHPSLRQGYGMEYFFLEKEHTSKCTVITQQRQSTEGINLCLQCFDTVGWVTRNPAKASGGRPYETRSRNMVATQKINFLTPVSYSLLQTVFQ